MVILFSGFHLFPVTSTKHHLHWYSIFSKLCFLKWIWKFSSQYCMQESFLPNLSVCFRFPNHLAYNWTFNKISINYTKFSKYLWNVRYAVLPAVLLCLDCNNYFCLPIGIAKSASHSEKYPYLKDKLCNSPKYIASVMGWVLVITVNQVS